MDEVGVDFRLSGTGHALEQCYGQVVQCGSRFRQCLLLGRTQCGERVDRIPRVNLPRILLEAKHESLFHESVEEARIHPFKSRQLIEWHPHFRPFMREHRHHRP